MPRKNSPYNHGYEKERARLIGLPCELRLVCDGDVSDSADHLPPISRHTHVNGSGCCILRPACMRCQARQKVMLAGQTRRFQSLGVPVPLIDAYQPSREWA
jgi:hypothetical protein